MSVPERDLYLPPDIEVRDNGTVAPVDWPKMYRFRNDRDSFVMSFTGMGMPPIRYIEQTGPYQHGVTVLDFRLQQRIIQYTIRRNGCSRTEYWNNRGELITALNPARQISVGAMEPGRLRKILPDGTKRDITAFILRGPIFAARNPSQWDEWAFTETLRFKCPDPTWFDPDRTDVEWTVAVYEGLIYYASPNYTDHLVYPNNKVYGSTVLSGSVSVTYTGSWFAYPIIYITGPVNYPSLTHVNLGTKIGLNYNIASGEIVTIDTTYGNKSIVNNAGTNLIGTLSDDSDLNFYIAFDPLVTGGVNTFIAAGSNAVEGETSLLMTYFTRYIGI